MTDTFREWFCYSEDSRHEICTGLKQRDQTKVLRISPESVKLHSVKFTMVFKLFSKYVLRH